MKTLLVAIGMLSFIGACAGNGAYSTVSFAPPVVADPCRHESRSGGKLMVETCAPEETLAGGLALVDAHIDAYRIAGGQLSNGRQMFDVPGLIAGIGGATAVALGANADVAIGTGAFGALTTTGKAYYAPNERADAYFDAVEALSCVQVETIGLGAKTKKARALVDLAEAQLGMEMSQLTLNKSTGSEAVQQSKRLELKAAQEIVAALEPVIVDGDYRAYLLMKANILAIENKVRVRLSAKGSVADTAAITALVTMYQKQIEAAKEKPSTDGFETLFAGVSAAAASIWDLQINLEELAPKLAQCTLLADG
jgi:hypothetical protein